jgi:hypothetical protein
MDSNKFNNMKIGKNKIELKSINEKFFNLLK